MGFFERLLMGGRHHGQGGGHHGGGHHRGQGGYPPAPVAVGMACPACRTANAATARFCQGCGGALAPLRCIAGSADLAAGAKFCGACGAPQQ